MKIKNIVIVGMGPHAKWVYYPYLEQRSSVCDLRIKLLIDLSDQENHIRTFLSDHKLKPENLLFVESEYRNCSELPVNVLQKLEGLRQSGEVDGILISTEPKAHKAYALWALDNNIDILMDKPITAPLMDPYNPEDAKKIFNDYLELEERFKQSEANMVIQVHRRRNPGYIMIRRLLEEFIDEFKVPITFLNISHASGTWNMPSASSSLKIRVKTAQPIRTFSVDDALVTFF